MIYLLQGVLDLNDLAEMHNEMPRRQFETTEGQFKMPDRMFKRPMQVVYKASKRPKKRLK